jgi:hypothetical protein
MRHRLLQQAKAASAQRRPDRGCLGWSSWSVLPPKGRAFDSAIKASGRAPRSLVRTERWRVVGPAAGAVPAKVALPAVAETLAAGAPAAALVGAALRLDVPATGQPRVRVRSPATRRGQVRQRLASSAAGAHLMGCASTREDGTGHMAGSIGGHPAQATREAAETVPRQLMAPPQQPRWRRAQPNASKGVQKGGRWRALATCQGRPDQRGPRHPHAAVALPAGEAEAVGGVAGHVDPARLRGQLLVQLLAQPLPKASSQTGLAAGRSARSHA